MSRAALALLVLLAVACSDDGGTVTVESGDTVSVFYTGTLDDGSQFDSNVGGNLLTFTVGAGQVIPGFEAAVTGVAVGETVTVRIEPADAYGARSDDFVLEVPAEGAPDGLQPGDRTQLNDGRAVTVVSVTDEVITVDANHPLAGEALTFEIEIVEVDR